MAARAVAPVDRLPRVAARAGLPVPEAVPAMAQALADPGLTAGPAVHRAMRAGRDRAAALVEALAVALENLLPEEGMT